MRLRQRFISLSSQSNPPTCETCRDRHWYKKKHWAKKPIANLHHQVSNEQVSNKTDWSPVGRVCLCPHCFNCQYSNVPSSLSLSLPCHAWILFLDGLRRIEMNLSLSTRRLTSRSVKQSKAKCFQEQNNSYCNILGTKPATKMFVRLNTNNRWAVDLIFSEWSRHVPGNVLHWYNQHKYHVRNNNG